MYVHMTVADCIAGLQPASDSVAAARGGGGAATRTPAWTPLR